MKRSALGFAVLALLSAVVIGAVSCSKGVGGVERTTVAATDDAVVVVDTLAIKATVTEIDEAKRKLTLTSADGGKTTCKAPPEMVNFDQLQVGDVVTAVVTEEVAVYIGSSAPPGATLAGGVVLAPVGGKPGGIAAEVEHVTVVATAVDIDKRKVTCELPDGDTKKVKVSKDVDLSKITVGEKLTAVMSERMAVEITTP